MKFLYIIYNLYYKYILKPCMKLQDGYRYNIGSVIIYSPPHDSDILVVGVIIDIHRGTYEFDVIKILPSPMLLRNSHHTIDRVMEYHEEREYRYRFNTLNRCKIWTRKELLDGSYPLMMQLVSSIISIDPKKYYRDEQEENL